MKNIRNFAIIAHIDHGKSTIADRIIEICGGLETREMLTQVLDSMEIERSRGITIKSQTVRLEYKARNGNVYVLNLIDTPGHVDFSYEVSRSLAACEGSVLIVDSTQGVEAQTLSNAYKAIESFHEIVVVLNKIDLNASEPDLVKEQIEEVIGLDTSNAVLVSAKTGEGIEDVLECVVNNIPCPQGDVDAPLQCLLIDSWYDTYLGVVVLIRVVNGFIKKGMKVLMMQTGAEYILDGVGVFTPKKEVVDVLYAGEIGFMVASIKQISDCKVGDTITQLNAQCAKPLKGFRTIQPVVFCGLFPVDSNEFEDLKDAISKLHLNDSSFVYDSECSEALGYGFRCGFLGLLHLEIIRERLESEFNLDLIATAPSVLYKVHTSKEGVLYIHNPSSLPDPSKIVFIQEPWITATLLLPDSYIGSILSLCEGRRGIQISLDFSYSSRVSVVYRLPLSEIVLDFYDRLKSLSEGYASFDWEFYDYQEAPVVKLVILVNSVAVDSMSFIIHRDRAEVFGREVCKRLKNLIPKQMYKVVIQAAIGSKIIAREEIKAFRKDVTAKCYGGDITRKRKLLEKQKRGKKKMKVVGNVEIPKSAFIAALRIEDDK